MSLVSLGWGEAASVDDIKTIGRDVVGQSHGPGLIRTAADLLVALGRHGGGAKAKSR
jgi:hypothetical protein